MTVADVLIVLDIDDSLVKLSFSNTKLGYYQFLEGNIAKILEKDMSETMKI